jgi:hypothetical protein
MEIPFMNNFTNKIDFLKSIGSNNILHSGQNLLDHLIGTSNKLKDLGEPEYLQDAGLFHSVYGTVYFLPENGLVDDRQTIKNIIGEKAEELAYWFCILEKPRIDNILKIKNTQLREDLLKLNQANLDDIATSNTMSWKEAYGI